jgi:hypothetical protein
MPGRLRGEVEVYLYLYSTVALDEGGWSAPCPDCLTPGKETRYPLYRRLVGPRASLDGSGNSDPHQGLNPRLSSL